MMQINEELWDIVINDRYSVEFDWVGIDKEGQIAIFSSLNTGFIPHKVKGSFNTFVTIMNIVDQTPTSTSATIVTKNSGNFGSWAQYSRQGFFAYDYQDVHRTKTLDQYDLISVPLQPVTITSLDNLLLNESAIPHFDLLFGEDISFEALINAELKAQC